MPRNKNDRQPATSFSPVTSSFPPVDHRTDWERRMIKQGKMSPDWRTQGLEWCARNRNVTFQNPDEQDAWQQWVSQVEWGMKEQLYREAVLCCELIQGFYTDNIERITRRENIFPERPRTVIRDIYMTSPEFQQAVRTEWVVLHKIVQWCSLGLSVGRSRLFDLPKTNPYGV